MVIWGNLFFFFDLLIYNIGCSGIEYFFVFEICFYIFIIYIYFILDVIYI